MKDLEIVFIDIFWWKMLLMRQLCFYSVLGRTDIITLSLILISCFWSTLSLVSCSCNGTQLGETV